MINIKEPFTVTPISEVIEMLTELRDEATKQEKWDYDRALTTALAWLEACQKGVAGGIADPAPTIDHQS